MASKAIYTVVAVAGIAGAATAAWWYPQPRPGSPDRALTEQAAVAAAPPSLDAASTGVPTGWPLSVEVASVEVVTLTDDTQAVVLRPEVSGR